MSEISETSYWLKFFMEAGIPPGDANEYAMTFSDNRIKPNMLLDLNKDYLQDMGITLMGDVISILKQAKLVSSKNAKALSQSSLSSSSLLPSNSKEALHKSPATRMLEHYVRKEPTQLAPAKSSLSQNLSSRLHTPKRLLEDESETLRPSKKNSVFKRLGESTVSSTTNDSPQITVTMIGKNKMGKKQLDSSDSQIECDESPTSNQPSRPLQYQGVLKYSSKELALLKKLEERKKIQTKLSKHLSPSVRARLGHVRKSSSESEGIFAKEAALTVANKPRPIVKEYCTNEDSEELTSDDDVDHYIPSLPPSHPTQAKKHVIKKIVTINKKTGQIVSERRKEVRSDTSSMEETD